MDIRGAVFPSYKTISLHTQISTSTVMRCIKVLEECGLVIKQVREKKGKKAKDSNLYIIRHPKQIPSLKKVVPQWNDDDDTLSHSGITSEQKVTTVEEPPCPTVVVYKDSLNTSSICSVVGDKNFIEVGEKWKEAFKTELLEHEYIDLISYGSVELILENIKLIHKHYKKEIDSPIAFVIGCIKRGGFKVKVPRRKNTVQKKTPPLPRAVQAQMDGLFTHDEITEEFKAHQERVEAKRIAMENHHKNKHALTS